MRVVWITYDRADYQINTGFVKMFEEAFEKVADDILVKVILTEDFRVSVEHGETCFYEKEEKLEKPFCVIARSRDFRLSRMIERAGIRVFNSSKVCEICNDKAATYQEVSRLSIPMPDTWFDRIPDDLSYPYVIKPVDGHGGIGVTMVTCDAAKELALKELGFHGKLDEVMADGAKVCTRHFVVQKPVSDLGKDVRVYVCGGKIIQAMLRSSESDFRSNFCLGGKASCYTLNEEEISYVQKLQDHFQFDFAGIDFIFDEGKAVFNEIEDVVGSRMLYSMTEIDIVSIYVDYLLSVLDS